MHHQTVLLLQCLQILFCHEMLENLPYSTSRYCDPSLEWAIDLTSSQERLLVLENKRICGLGDSFYNPQAIFKRYV